MRRIFVIITLCAALSLGSTAAFAQDLKENQRLDKIHAGITDQYPQLSHVSQDEMAALLSSDDILWLDVREPEEFAVSHIGGAMQVNPNISAADFLARFKDKAAGKHVILYCSVGRRSSKLGDNVRAELMAAGAKNASNLEGGIFRWHNQEQPLVSATGETDKVHPYNLWWGRLVAHKGKIAYIAE